MYIYIGAIGYDGGHFASGNGSILLNDVFCLGSESKLLDCTYFTSIGISDCTHNSDAGVACLAASLSTLAIVTIAAAVGATLFGVLFITCLVIALVARSQRRRNARNYRRLQQPVSRSTVAVNCADTSLDEMNQVSHHFLLFI